MNRESGLGWHGISCSQVSLFPFFHTRVHSPDSRFSSCDCFLLLSLTPAFFSRLKRCENISLCFLRVVRMDGSKTKATPKTGRVISNQYWIIKIHFALYVPGYSMYYWNPHRACVRTKSYIRTEGRTSVRESDLLPPILLSLKWTSQILREIFFLLRRWIHNISIHFKDSFCVICIKDDYLKPWIRVEQQD